MALRKNNPASYYMGRRRGKGGIAGGLVSDDGHDILRVIPTMASVGMSEAKSDTVSGYAGYKVKHQDTIFDKHMQTLDDKNMIVTKGNFVSLTPQGEAFVEQHEIDWLKIEINGARHRPFKKFCEEKRVEHLLKFSHKAQTNLEVLQRWITFFSQGLKCEQAFRFLYATPNIPITKERRNEVIEYFDLKKDWGRYFQCWLEPMDGHSTDGFPKQLLNCLFPDGRNAPPAMWCMQPVFRNPPKKPKPEVAAQDTAPAAEPPQRTAPEDPPPAHQSTTRKAVPRKSKRRRSQTNFLGFGNV